MKKIFHIFSLKKIQKNFLDHSKSILKFENFSLIKNTVFEIKDFEGFKIPEMEELLR